MMSFMQNPENVPNSDNIKRHTYYFELNENKKKKNYQFKVGRLLNVDEGLDRFGNI